jgi:hypothetical protein
MFSLPVAKNPQRIDNCLTPLLLIIECRDVIAPSGSRR